MDRRLAAGLASLLLAAACQGQDGRDGKDGTAWLVRLEAEPRGGNCPLGGTAVLAGPDADGDGALDAAEVAETSYVCAGSVAGCTTLQGSLTIRNEWDWQNLLTAGCTALTGELVVEAPGLGSLPPAPALAEVGALLVRANDRLTGLSLPALTRVRGDVRVTDNPALASIAFPALARVDGILEIGTQAYLGPVDGGLQALGTLALPSLVSTNGMRISRTGVSSISLPLLATSAAALEFVSNPALTSLGLPALTAADVAVVDAPLLTTLTLPAMTSGALTVQDVPGLSSLSAPVLATSPAVSLASVGLPALELPALREATLFTLSAQPRLTTLSVPALARADTVALAGLEALTAIRLPALTAVTGNFQVYANALLSLLDVPALASVGQSAYLVDNPVLPECQAQALVDRWQAAGGLASGFNVSGNDAAATCP